MPELASSRGAQIRGQKWLLASGSKVRAMLTPAYKTAVCPLLQSRAVEALLFQECPYSKERSGHFGALSPCRKDADARAEAKIGCPCGQGPTVLACSGCEADLSATDVLRSMHLT